MISRCLLAICLVVFLAAVTRGEDIPLGVGPSQPTKAGLTMTMSAPRLGNEGFHPIKIQFKPLGKQFNRQRELTLRFRPRDQYAAELDHQFECRVTIPQDAKSFETTVLVPHFHRWQSCWMRVYEDGRPLGKLPTHLAISQPVMDWGQEVGFGIIVPHDAATSGEPWAVFPDLRTLVTVFGRGPIDESVKTERFSEKEARDYLDRLDFGFARFRVLEEKELPESWLAYSQLDVMVAPYPVFERLASEAPESIAPLLKWVSTGGELWLYAAPKGTTAANELLGGLPPTDSGFKYAQDPSQGLELRQENIRSSVEYETWSRSYNQGYTSSGTYRRDAYQALVDAKHPMTEEVKRKQLLETVRLGSYGLGRVALITTEDPFPGSFQLWKGLTKQTQQWNYRQGVDYANGSDSYWAWLMNAVGGPPVTMFIGFNVIFVVLIGPILYFSLRRNRRLYLLYFLAPALAFLATTGLFFYAFASDGFSNRGRVRMLSWIDARGGLENCPIVNQSRETYYTVVDSRLGLQFDRDTLALPIIYPERITQYRYFSSNDNSPGRYRVEENASGRRYGGDFLETRTQTQFLTTLPETGTCPIEVDFSASPPKLTNRWDTELQAVLVCDKQKNYWIAESVAASETQVMRQTEFEEFATRLTQQEALVPLTTTASVPYRVQNGFADRSFVEQHFKRVIESPKTNSFLIITEVPESRFAIRDCTPEQSIRLIGGLLP
ncbi:MAG: hypothetical protein AAFX06_12075 [Planctomycetota bacterium]